MIPSEPVVGHGHFPAPQMVPSEPMVGGGYYGQQVYQQTYQQATPTSQIHLMQAPSSYAGALPSGAIASQQDPVQVHRSYPAEGPMFSTMSQAAMYEPVVTTGQQFHQEQVMQVTPRMVPHTGHIMAAPQSPPTSPGAKKKGKGKWKFVATSAPPSEPLVLALPSTPIPTPAPQPPLTPMPMPAPQPQNYGRADLFAAHQQMSQASMQFQNVQQPAFVQQAIPDWDGAGGSRRDTELVLVGRPPQPQPPPPQPQPQPAVHVVTQVVEKPYILERIVEKPVYYDSDRQSWHAQATSQIIDHRDDAHEAYVKHHAHRQATVTHSVKREKVKPKHHDTSFPYHDPTPDRGCGFVGHYLPPTNENAWLTDGFFS